MKNILFAISVFLPFYLHAQLKNEPDTLKYPQHYFRNPLNIPIFLAGNFGECRPGHFHSGVDIKTKGVENQPVHAAADGYISRIKTESGGFGHALYITHPNGYTTLYAHLNDYAPAIEKYLRHEQYKKERWDIDVQLSPSTFPVKKGQQIAWSGNTGASTAPHLHFEIRSTKTEHPLNPEQFGLPIIDKKPPVPTELAVYDLANSIYEQTPQIIALVKKGSVYIPKEDTVKAISDAAGVGLRVNDYMEGSDNTIAFYKARVYLDNKLQTEVTLDDIGYDVTRYVNAYADYKTEEQKDITIQCFFKLPNNQLSRIFTYLNDKQGGLALNDDRPHKARIEVIDDKGNTSTVSFYLKFGGENNSNTKSCANLFKAGQVNNFEQPNVSFTLDETELYDDICFQYSTTPDDKDFSDHYMIHYSYVPVHHYFDLNIKPNSPVPFQLRDKVAMIHSDGKREDGRAATYGNQGWYKASVRNFGTYWLAADTVAPEVRPLQKIEGNMSKAKQITFVAKDAMTSVKKFVGELDGKWLCFEQHNDLFFYKFDEHCPKGKHELVIKATDENDNTKELHYTFTR